MGAEVYILPASGTLFIVHAGLIVLAVVLIGHAVVRRILNRRK